VNGVIIAMLMMLAVAVPAFADEKVDSLPKLPPPTVDPGDAKERQKALKEFIKKKGLINVAKGAMLCTDNRLGVGYIVAGERRKDLTQAVDVYKVDVHRHATLEKKGLSAFLTKPENNAGGIDVISNGQDGEMLVHRSYECKMKFEKEKPAKSAPKK